MKKSLNYIINLFFILLPYLNVLLYLRGFYDFEIAKYFYFANILLLLPLFFYDIKRKAYLGFWIFILPFMYTLPWIVLGLDMTDEVFNLAVSWFYPIKGSFVISASPVSYFLSHLWLKIAGAPYILWERLAVNTILSLVLFFSYKTLRLLKEDVTDRWGFILIIYMAMAIISYNWFRFLVPYDKVPMLLLTIFVYLLYLSVNQDNKYMFLLAGLFFVFTAYSKITFFFIVFVFPLIVFINKKTGKKYLLYFIYGIVAGLFVLFILKIDLLYAFKGFKEIISNQDTNILCFRGKTHTVNSLLRIYYNESLKILQYFIVVIVLFSVSQFFIDKKIKIVYSAAIRFFIFFVFTIITIWAVKKYHFPKEYLRWFWTSFAVYTALIFISVFLMLKNDVKKWGIVAILGFILLISFIGTNVGFRKIQFNYAVAFALPIVIGLVYKDLDKKVLFFGLLYPSIMGFLTNYNYVYRDYPIKYLNIQSEFSLTKGIFTKKEKMKEIENFYNQIKNEDIQNARYITTNKTFLYTLLLNRRPYSLCWHVSDTILEKILSEGFQLDYVIFSTTSMRRSDWDKKRYFAIHQDRQRIMHIQKLLNTYMTKRVQSPKAIFILYKK